MQPFKAEVEAVRSSPLRASSSKSSLINRFLRNVTVKKMLDLKVEKKQQFSTHYLSLVVNGGCKNDVEEARIKKVLEDEISKGKMLVSKAKDADVDANLQQLFRRDVFRNRSEKMLHSFSVKSSYSTSGDCQQLIVAITECCLYVVGYTHPDNWCNHFVLPYTDLNTVIIGPDLQTVHLSNYEKDMQSLFVTGCSNATREFMGKLEFAMRRDKNRPKLPAVKQLCMRDMLNLRRAICKQSSVHKVNRMSS